MTNLRTILAVLVLLLPTAGHAAPSPADVPESTRVLFVGNSLTYTGNLPAVLDALRSPEGSRTTSDMIVAPGATLTDRVKDGTVRSALESGKYQFVVLQERGGDFACGFGPEVCVNARQALAELARLARASGVTPILLGTYQGSAAASQITLDAESKAAVGAGVAYISVANRLHAMREEHPKLTWFASDGMHPGSDLTLLEAILLFRETARADPVPAAISVKAPIFSFRSPLKPEVRHSTASEDSQVVSDGITYERERMALLASGLRLAPALLR